MSWWMWLVLGEGIALVGFGLFLLWCQRQGKLAEERERTMAQYDDMVPWWSG